MNWIAMSEHHAVCVTFGSIGMPHASAPGGAFGILIPLSLSQTCHMFFPGHESLQS